MSDTDPGVLITRPEPGATDTAARVAALGLYPIVAPLLQINPLPARLPPSGQIQAIVVASGNAIPTLPASHRHLPLFAVGEATANRAREAGFERIERGDGDAEALAALVAQECVPGGGPLLLATGRGQGGALARDLRQRGFAVIRRVVYAAEPVPLLPDNARVAFGAGRLRAALFFSAETARTGVRLLQLARLDEAVSSVDALAISRTAAVALEPLRWRRVRVAEQPNQDAMLALLQ